MNTFSDTGAALDYGVAMVAILPAVGVDANTDVVNPAILSNGMPSGTIPSNVSGVLVSFNTDSYAICRYATSSGVSYDSMTNNTVSDFLGTFHTFSVMGIVEGDTYTYYVRCTNYGDIKNKTDYVISFYAGEPTGSGLGGGLGGGTVIAPPGSSGGGGGGGGDPFPPGPALPSLAISGVSFPGMKVAVLQDGSKIPVKATPDGLGNFSMNIQSLSQGTYLFHDPGRGRQFDPGLFLYDNDHAGLRNVEQYHGRRSSADGRSRHEHGRSGRAGCHVRTQRTIIDGGFRGDEPAEPREPLRGDDNGGQERRLVIQPFDQGLSEGYLSGAGAVVGERACREQFFTYRVLWFGTGAIIKAAG